MKPNRRNPLFSNLFRCNTLTSVIVASLGSSAVQAADVYWDRGSATNAWGTAGNWSATDAAAATTGALPATGDVAVFNISALNTAQTVDMGADRTITGLRFVTTGTLLIQGGGTNRTLNVGADGLTKSGTGAITIGNTTANQNANVRLTTDQLWSNSNNTGAITVQNSVAASTSVNRLLTLGGSSTAANTINGVISNNGAGVFSLTKSGTGLWVLAGANTFTGAVNVSGGGTLRVQNSTGLGAGTVVNVDVGGTAGGQGTTLDIRNTISVASGKTLTLNSNTTGDLRTTLLNGANNNSWNSNIVASGTGLVQINAAAGTTLTINGQVTSTGGGGTGTLFTRGGGTVIYNGLINLGTDRVFSKTEAGTVIVNSTGHTWVSTRAADGQIQVGANNALANVDFIFGQGSGTNGRLELNGFNQTLLGFRSDAASTGTNHILRNSNLLTASTLTWATPAATTNILRDVQVQGTTTGYGVLNLVANNAGRTEFQNGLFAADSLTVNSGTVAFTGTANRILAGSIAGAAGAAIDKEGTTSLVADGAWNNLGTTNLNGGTLMLGNGTSGTLNVATDTILAAGNGGGVLNLANLNFAPGATTYAPVLGAPSVTAPVNSNTITADSTVTVIPLGSLGVGTYALLDYATLGGAGFSAFSLGPVGSYPHMTASLVNNTGNGRVDLAVTAVDSLVWRGSVDGVWDLNTTQNFVLASNNLISSTFYTGDAVLFNDTNSVSDISGPDQITGKLTFNNSNFPYTISNALTVLGDIVKGGTSSVTLSGANLIHGAVAVNQGTLKIGNANALRGSSSVTVANGATIDAGGIVPGVKYDLLTVSGAGVDSDFDSIGDGAIVNSGAGITNNNHFTNIVLAGNTSWGGSGRYDIAAPSTFNGGSFTLTKVGTGELWFNPRPGATVGNIVVNGGTFGIQATNMLATTTNVTVNNGAFHNLFNANDVQHQVVVNDGGTFQSTGGTGVVNGNITLNGTDTNRFLGGSATLNIAGKITGTGGFTKNGAGAMNILSTTSDYAGDTRVLAGNLNMSPTGVIPSTTNLIVDGGVFDTWDRNHTVASISGSGGRINTGAGNLWRLTTTQSTTTEANTQVDRVIIEMSGTGNLTLGGSTDNVAASAIVNSGTLIAAKGNVTEAPQASHSFGGTNVTINGGTLRLGGTYNNLTNLGTGQNTPPAGFNTANYVDQFYNNTNLVLNAGTFDLNGREEAINGLSNPTGLGGTVTNSSTTAAKLYVGYNNATSTFDGALNNGAGTLALAKLGTGTLTLTGTSTFSGGLTQTAGAVVISPTAVLGNTPITVAANTFTFDGTHGNGAIAVDGTSVFTGAGTSGGILSAASGSTVRVGTASAGTIATTLKLGGLSLSGGANLNLDFNPAGTAVDKIVTSVSNGVTLNGTNNLNVVPGSAGWKSGTYPIITYTGTVGGTGASALTLTTPVGHSTVSISDDAAGNINLVVTAGGDNRWVGGNGDAWDIDTTLNWSLTGQKFLNGDTAVFADTASTFNPIIFENVTPVAVIFDNTTAKPYTLSGNSAFGIIGTGGLLKKNTGTATMESVVNAYTGNTTVQAGTLIANFNAGTATTSIPTGSLVQVDAGATLKVVANDGNITFNNRVTGSGTVVVDPHLTAAAAVREVNINSTGTTFTGTIRLSPSTGVDTGLGTFRTNAVLTAAGIGAATIDVDAGGQAWINGETFTNNFIISGHGFAETAGGTPVAASGLTAYTDATLKGGIGAIRMNANAVITGNVTLDGTAKIMSYGATGTISGSISTTNATDMLVIGGGGSGTNIILTGTNNTGANPLRDIFVNGGSTTAQGNLLVIGANGTTGTLGTGAVILNGDGGNGNVRFDRSDGYTLAAGNTITSVGTNTANTRLWLDSVGGFNQNGVAINLGSGALQTGTLAGRLNSVANLDGNVTVGAINLGTAVTGSTLNILPGANIVNSGNFFLGEQVNNSATANQSGGSTTVGAHVRIGHWSTETSTYNISAGTLAVTANPGLATNPSGTGEQNGGIYLGIDGTGILNQSGTSTVTTDWVVLDNRGETLAGTNMPDGIDRYNLSGGTLEIRGAYGIIQRHATTEFNFTGGTIKNVGSGVNVVISGPGTFALGTGGSGTPTFDTGGATNSITVLRSLSGNGGLIKTGAGTLSLTAINNYTGDTTVVAGTLAVSGASIADSNTLRINAGGVVAPTGTETVGALYFDGVPQAQGTWGASGSGATNIDNVRFSGTSGVVNVVSVTSPYSAWAAAKGLVGGDADPGADPDQDGVSNILEFATNADPKNGGSQARAYAKMHSIAGENALTYTVAVRVGAAFAPNGSKQEAVKDGVRYRIEATNDLTSWNTVPVTELGAVDSAAVQAAITPALPALDSGWEWRSFRTDGGSASDPSDLIRLQVQTSP